MQAFKSFLNVYMILLLISLPIFGVSQSHEKVIFYGKDYFLLEGTPIAEHLKENRYDRLPLSYKKKVRKPVWELSKNSAGLSIRFLSNSSQIKVKWTVLNNTKMNHMPETGIKGIDLYYNNNGTWEYVNTAKPNDFENEYTLVSNMSATLREYKMFLPLYDGLNNIEVGVDANSTITKPNKQNRKPIVFYGTSITQGGCASRPGMAHTNIISRKLDRECFNFGFSGNGKMEQPIAELISKTNALIYVIECLPNMDAEMVKENTIPLVKTIRKNQPNTPILLVENFLYEGINLDQNKKTIIQNKNKALKNQYEILISKGFKNIYLISSENATGRDHESTVDGVHFTDLGFMRYANYLIQTFNRLHLLE